MDEISVTLTDFTDSDDEWTPPEKKRRLVCPEVKTERRSRSKSKAPKLSVASSTSSKKYTAPKKSKNQQGLKHIKSKTQKVNQSVGESFRIPKGKLQNALKLLNEPPPKNAYEINRETANCSIDITKRHNYHLNSNTKLLQEAIECLHTQNWELLAQIITVMTKKVDGIWKHIIMRLGFTALLHDPVAKESEYIVQFIKGCVQSKASTDIEAVIRHAVDISSVNKDQHDVESNEID